MPYQPPGRPPKATKPVAVAKYRYGMWQRVTRAMCVDGRVRTNGIITAFTSLPNVAQPCYLVRFHGDPYIVLESEILI